MNCPPIPIPSVAWWCGGLYLYHGGCFVFNWLKKLFSKPEPVASMPIKEENKLLEKPCRTCGKPIFYDPSWEHIPNYCKECKRKYQDEHNIPKIMKRKCRSCGKQFTFPSTIKHYPNYGKDCRAKFKEKKA